VSKCVTTTTNSKVKLFSVNSDGINVSTDIKAYVTNGTTPPASKYSMKVNKN
jgi:hypothetical protein